MDPITHALTGGLLSNAGFSQRLGSRCHLAMAVGAMFPDIDIVYRFYGLPTYIENHRGLTHSYIGIVATGIVIGLFMGRLEKQRRYLAWISAIWVAAMSHQILDLITSYGTIVLYPFNKERFYFDWVFIVDFILTGTLLLFLLVSRSRKTNRERIAKTGVFLALIYVGFCALNHRLAIYQLSKSAEANKIEYRAVAAIPQPLLPLRWSGILDAGNYYYQTVFLNIKRPEPPFEVFTKSTGSFWENQVRSSELGVLYYWFARYPVIEETIRNHVHTLEVYDLRFYIKLHGFPVRKPFVLQFKLDQKGNILESRFVRL